uniref:Large ribosomal subunit protein mL37 n=1 Tax=Ixodes ricinus TaxID=34613 RepID=A0A6B0VCJ5_IXORI
MRLTAVLCKQSERWIKKELWKNRKTLRKVGKYSTPSVLLEKGVAIHDALDVADDRERLEPFELPEPHCVPNHQRNDSQNPDWHDKAAYVLHNKTRLLEGDRHMRLLTKTLRYEGLPESLMTAVEREPLTEEQARAAEEALLHAHLWDCTQVKLPKKLDISKPHWVFPREYGVPVRRKVPMVLANFNRLCEKMTSSTPGVLERSLFRDIQARACVHKADGNLLVFSAHVDSVLTSKEPLGAFSSPEGSLFRDIEARACVHKADGNLLVFSAHVDSVLTSKEPLGAFSSPEEVKATADTELPDLYPAKYTLELESRNIYKMDELYPMPRTSGNQHPHTLHVTHPYDYFWFPQQKLARAILASFTFAAARARQLYGADTVTPPEPVAVQCTFSDVKSFGFLAYQLNTLDLREDNGIKNQVWVDGPHDLYGNCNHETGLEGFSPVAFQRFLALYKNGLAA